MLSIKRTLIALVASAALVGCAGNDAPVAQNVDDLREDDHLGASDVTVLYPQPQNHTLDHLMAGSSEGDKGELFSGALFEQLLAVEAPPFFDGDGNEVPADRLLLESYKRLLPSLRVTGLRIDPCRGALSYDYVSSCVGQIRLVAQFFPKPTNGANVRVDGRVSLHLIYSLSQADFLRLVQGMLALRHDANLPLQKGFVTGKLVHPTMAAEGIDGPYVRAVNELVLKYAGVDSLESVAVAIQDFESGSPNGYYATQNNRTRWVFASYRHDDGTLSAEGIATTDATMQTVDTDTRGFTRRAAAFRPTSETAVAISPLFNFPPDTGRKDALIHVASILNPERHTVGNTDCASCHMAKDAPFIARRSQLSPPDTWDVEFRSHIYRLDDLKPASGAGPFRHFGYDTATQPVISDRVVNDTAFTLQVINTGVLE